MSRASRAASHLPPPGDLDGYPEEELREGLVVYRSHRTGYGPWYFASASADAADGGRFDLLTPHGTCYTAVDPVTALRERFGPQFHDVGAVTAEAVVGTKLSRLRLQESVVVANTSAEPAADFHTRELVTTYDYGLARQWAQAFHGRGLGGVRYQSRFTTTRAAAAIALFGKAGGKSWPVDATQDVSAWMRQTGMTVLTHRPRVGRFTKATPPRRP